MQNIENKEHDAGSKLTDNGLCHFPCILQFGRIAWIPLL